MMYRITVFFVPIILFCYGLGAQDSTATYTMVFSARPPALEPFSIGGHAYVTWTKTSTLDSAIDKMDTYGFYPSKSLKISQTLANVKGRIVAGYEKNRNGHPAPLEIMIEINDSVYNSTLNAMQKWDSEQYNLCNNNCLSFLDDMAESIGLKTPSTRSFLFFPKTPSKYVKQLHRKNTRTRMVDKNWYNRVAHPRKHKRELVKSE